MIIICLADVKLNDDDISRNIADTVRLSSRKLLQNDN